MAFSSDTALVPLPRSLDLNGDTFALAESSRIVTSSPVLAEILAGFVEERTGLRLETATAPARSGDISLVLDSDAPAESYTLRVSDRVEITGDDAGLFYGAQTLRQLLRRHDEAWTLPTGEISDAPRYAYRGVMLDVARTFFDVETVKAFIDRASSLKFNHLHLHLTDDQGWRLDIASRPLLTERAATGSTLGRPGGFYTQDDYREIVRYATEHHMVVVPEIDLPGHTHAIGLAYPDVVEEPVLNDSLLQQSHELAQPLPVKGERYDGWGVGHSSVVIHGEETWAFLRDVLAEVADLSPGPYLHIGGDEALGTAPHDFNSFIERVTALVQEYGKTPVAWHEAGSAEVAPGTIGQYWGNTDPQGSHAEEARRFAERGGSIILSPSNTAYLDQKYHADFPLGLTWAALIDLKTAYQWEPEDIVPGLGTDQILGIEGPLWSETPATLDDVDELFFPRAAALAEIAWSAKDSRSWDSFRQRVGGLGALWDAAGWDGYRPSDIDWSKE